MVEPQYKPGWEDIDELIAKRDRDNKDPECGPPPASGYPRFMWIRSRWGWETDQWAQRRRIHDTSSAWRDDDGVLRVYCSCGLIVPMTAESTKRWSKRSGLHNFHAPDRDVNLEFDTEFFSARGHRDAYFGTTSPSFIARISAECGPAYHLWCGHCGDLGNLGGLVAFLNSEDLFLEKAVAVMTVHDLACTAGTSTKQEG